jgi:Fe-S cluster assembly protein SufD
MTPFAEGCVLADLLPEARPPAWTALRQAAEARLAGRGLPGPGEEDWKYTDLQPLRAMAPTPGGTAGCDIRDHILPEARGTRLVFMNGHFDDHQSNTSALPPGVRMLRLSLATEAASLLGSLATPATNDVFANLNTARFAEGALVYVPRGLQVEPVLHVLFVSGGGDGRATCAMPRLLVILEPGASLSLVEEYTGEGPYLTNAVTEVLVQGNASLTHERVQRESGEAVHLSTLAARVGRDAQYVCRTLSFGARLSRQNPLVSLAEEGAALDLQGLALVGGDQVADTHSRIDHRVPHGTSRQLHKAIADGSARIVFNGQIFVHPGAQKTDAQQQSRNLLLSPTARVDAKPQLEIFADDVRCAHGATVGQLDPDAFFYLQSRGLDEPTARNLLLYGFASQILAQVSVPSLRKSLRQIVMERTGKMP